MSTRWTRRTTALLSLLFSPMAFAANDDNDDRDDAEESDAPTQNASAPEAIRAAMARSFPRAEIVASKHEHTEVGDAWRLSLRERLATREVVVDPGGEIVAQCEELPASAAPEHVRRAVARQFGSPSLWHVQHLTGAGEEAWLFTFSRGDRAGRALFDGEGKLVHGEYDAAGRGRA